MTAAGELERNDAGDYVLVGSLAQRQREQQASLTARPARWDGTWRMAIAVGDARPAGIRADVRLALKRSRLAEWREGVWIRPANVADLVEDPRCAWLDARPDGDPVVLADVLFAPREWRAVADELLMQLHIATGRMRVHREDAIVDAFLAGAAALRHIRSDPWLPPALLPDPWPGSDLRTAYRGYRTEFATLAHEWFRSES